MVGLKQIFVVHVLRVLRQDPFQIDLFLNPSWSTVTGMEGNAALVCMPAGKDVGKRLNTLPTHPALMMM